MRKTKLNGINWLKRLYFIVDYFENTYDSLHRQSATWQSKTSKTYEAGVQQIPVACITVEDSQMLKRIQDRGEKIEIELNMTCENFPNTTSRNIVAEIIGREHPEQTVMFGGHFDSWDVGQGAMDDGGGVIIVWEAMSIIKALGLPISRRTLRSVFWTAEEVGLVGSAQYFQRHWNEAGNISLAMESDIGTFRPLGIGFNGSGLARAIMEEILSLLAPINATFVGNEGDGPDTRVWVREGVPGVTLVNANEKYFYFHHSHGDTMEVEDPHFLDLCTALWTSVAYVVADLKDMLPRTGDYPETSYGFILKQNWILNISAGILSIITKCWHL